MERDVGLTTEEVHDVAVFRARCEANKSAERRQPQGPATRAEVDGFVLFSWDEQTTSLGVELWLTEHALVPVTVEDLHVLQNMDFPKANEALVALHGPNGGQVHVLHRENGEIKILQAEKVSGSGDDLWYPGADWNPGVIFPAKPKV